MPLHVFMQRPAAGVWGSSVVAAVSDAQCRLTFLPLPANRCRGRNPNHFRSALFEVEKYLREGELPPCMLPWHNDGHGAGGGELAWC